MQIVMAVLILAVAFYCAMKLKGERPYWVRLFILMLGFAQFVVLYTSESVGIIVSQVSILCLYSMISYRLQRTLGNILRG